jgi:RimJ/RimL family protein N-acetyltransferase
VLRTWRDSDRAEFFRLNGDQTVARYLPAPLSAVESDAFFDQIVTEWAQRGYGRWAVERAADSAFIGFVGLHYVDFPAPFTPAVEIGWRLLPSAWDHGFATEAAAAAIDDGFGRCGLTDIVSFTYVGHLRSQRVMQRLGMVLGGEFEHPGLPPGHRLRPHVWYRLTR